jgi:hypothetical protein
MGDSVHSLFKGCRHRAPLAAGAQGHLRPCLARAAIAGLLASMPGRARLPGGEPRKVSQRNTRRAVSPAAKATPVWRASMPVLWKGRAGIFRRDVGDGEHAEVVIEGRIYRVRIGELQ